ncbi:MAG: bifunctional enoyl-CoA hydratase/phosphate acetyltransferase [Coprothermobacterota bacterium]|nr:bifunctional enoyl-CoA hydratase/phosphate acetyltransferase [Coprothermobacterota bacterium]
MIKDFQQTLEAARRLPPQAVAVASPEEENTLRGLEEARLLGLIRPHLFGDIAQLSLLAEKIGLDPANYAMHEATSSEQAAFAAVSFCREGKADVLMKGFLPTPIFLRAVLHKENGIATGSLLCHVAIFQLPALERLLFITDGGMVVLPTLTQKLEILRHAVEVAKAMENSNPKVAVIASVETVSAEIPATVDAAIMTTMWRRKQIKGCIVDGPLALDNALSHEALAEKGIDSPLFGAADILLMPNIESGNVLGKSIVYLASGIMAGVVMGAKVPIVLVSRVDPPESKIYSLAISALLAARGKVRL